MLRDYQQKVINHIWRYYEYNDGNPIVAMPTGTGKSHVIADVLNTIKKHNKKAILLSHVKEILLQDYKCFIREYGHENTGIYSSGLKARDIDQITIAGIASVYKKSELFGKVSALLIDECHLVSPKGEAMYSKFIAGLKKQNENLKIIGFSATPFRTKEGYLQDGPIFTDLCFDMTTQAWFKKLIADNYLAPLVVKKPNTEYNVESVTIRGGDFVPAELQKTVDKQTITDSVINEILKLSDNRKHWLVFASGIDHTIHVTEALKNVGVIADCVHSNLSNEQRDKVISNFKQGKIQAIVNNNILTTGFDFPGIDLIVVLRPTLSPVLWVQLLGRGTRPNENKNNCLVLDFAGNTKRLGPIDSVYLPFAHKHSKKSLLANRAPLRVCPKCNVFNAISASVCVNCGFEFPKMSQISKKADILPVMSLLDNKPDLPGANWYSVVRVHYKAHTSKSGKQVLLVKYICGGGINVFNEYVCFEHIGFARFKAVSWWQKRCLDKSIPNTITQALQKINLGLLRIPLEVKVKKVSKWFEIIDCRLAKEQHND